MISFHDLSGRHSKPKLILTEDEADCGLACITMLANSFGHTLSVESIRRRYDFSTRGTPLKSVIKVLGELDLVATAYRISSPDEMPSVKLPALLFWKKSHYVVLASISLRGNYEVLDPAEGKILLSPEKFFRYFSGVAVEVTPAPEFNRICEDERSLFHWVRPWIKGMKGTIAAIASLAFVLQIMSLLPIFVVKVVVDTYSYPESANFIFVLIIAAALAAIFSGYINYLRDWGANFLSQSLNENLTTGIVRHLVALPSAFFERRSTGDILSRITSLAHVQSFLTASLLPIFLDLGLAIVLAIVLLSSSVSIGALVLALTIFTAAAPLWFHNAIGAASATALRARASEQALLIENIEGMSTIKVLGGEYRRHMLWHNRFSNVVQSSFALGQLSVQVRSLQILIEGCQLAAILWFVVLDIEAGSITIGTAVVIVSLRQLFSDRISSLVNHALGLRILQTHLHRLSVITDEHARDLLLSQKNTKASVVLENVSFRYSQSLPWVLRHINLTISDGEYIGIRGASGEGKTTLTKMLTGLLQPSEGTIYAGGEPVSADEWDHLRSSMGVVGQEDRLFEGTILENVSFFDADPDTDFVEQICRDVGIHSQIISMPMGYSTRIGQRGTTLSGGQRQRLMLARALYRRPSILILDEGTANLDLAAEEQIGLLIRGLQVTRIVVSHRPRLLELADRVFELSDGALKEKPTPQIIK